MEYHLLLLRERHTLEGGGKRKEAASGPSMEGKTSARRSLASLLSFHYARYRDTSSLGTCPSGSAADTIIMPAVGRGGLLSPPPLMISISRMVTGGRKNG